MCGAAEFLACQVLWQVETFEVLRGYFNTSAKLHRFFEAKSGSIITTTFPQSKSAHPTQT